MRRDRSTPNDDDRGFTLVFVALVLTILMVFAAFAVDLGALYSERRIDQNSADAAATSGGVEFLRIGSTQAAITEAVAKVTADLGRTVTSAEWIACTDDNALARTAVSLSLTPATACISFSSTFGRMRVRLPDQQVATTFGRVAGIDEFTSNAVAEVSFGDPGGGALPFVLMASDGSVSEICLRSGGGQNPPDVLPPTGDPFGVGRVPDPCNDERFDTASGAEGTTLPFRYDGACTNGPGNQSVVDAIISGMDHPLGVFDPEVTLNPGDNANTLDSNPDFRADGSNSCATALPNALEVDSGFTAQELECALLLSSCTRGTAATSGDPGRLHDSGSSSTFNTFSVDDTALWEYFVPGLPLSAPASCTTAQLDATEFYLRRAALADCLRNWSTGELFTEQVAENPRFGYIPRVAERGLCRDQPAVGDGCSGPLPNYVHINNFAAVYMDGLYSRGPGPCDSSNASTVGSTWAIHYPGKDLDCGSSTVNVDRLSALVVPCGSLPASVCDPSSNPPFPSTVGILKVQLAK